MGGVGWGGWVGVLTLQLSLGQDWERRTHPWRSFSLSSLTFLLILSWLFIAADHTHKHTHTQQ